MSKDDFTMLFSDDRDIRNVRGPTTGNIFTWIYSKHHREIFIIFIERRKMLYKGKNEKIEQFKKRFFHSSSVIIGENNSFKER